MPKKWTTAQKIQLHINASLGRVNPPGKLPPLTDEEYLLLDNKLMELKNEKINRSRFQQRATVFPKPSNLAPSTYPQIAPGQPIDIAPQIAGGYQTINGEIIPQPLPSANNNIYRQHMTRNNPNTQQHTTHSTPNNFGNLETLHKFGQLAFPQPKSGKTGKNVRSKGHGTRYAGQSLTMDPQGNYTMTPIGAHQHQFQFASPEYIGPQTTIPEAELQKKIREDKARPFADALRELKAEHPDLSFGVPDSQGNIIFRDSRGPGVAQLGPDLAGHLRELENMGSDHSSDYQEQTFPSNLPPRPPSPSGSSSSASSTRTQDHRERQERLRREMGDLIPDPDTPGLWRRPPVPSAPPPAVPLWYMEKNPLYRDRMPPEPTQPPSPPPSGVDPNAALREAEEREDRLERQRYGGITKREFEARRDRLRRIQESLNP